MDDPSFYGFPTYGEAGPKAAQDCGGQPTTPTTRTFERDEAASPACGDFLAAHLPGAVGPDIYTKTCLYTLTPDRDFVVDRLPEAPGVVVAPRRGPRLQVRLGARVASLAELRLRRRDAVGRRARAASGSTGRSCSRPIRPTSWMV